MFVHSADKLPEMRTKFHIIQAKLIMSVWCFTVHWLFIDTQYMNSPLRVGKGWSLKRSLKVTIQIS